MTSTYTQIQKKIAVLQRQADALRAKEVSGVIDRIKVAIEHYGLTADQLGFGAQTTGSKRVTKLAAKRAGLVARYSDGQGNEWSGRGPRPRWLKEALASGRTLEELTGGADRAAAGGSKASPVRTTVKRVVKRKSKSQYRDEAGNTWGGMGPRPQWLRLALENGRSLGDFLVN